MTLNEYVMKTNTLIGRIFKHSHSNLYVVASSEYHPCPAAGNCSREERTADCESFIGIVIQEHPPFGEAHSLFTERGYCPKVMEEVKDEDSAVISNSEMLKEEDLSDDA